MNEVGNYGQTPETTNKVGKKYFREDRKLKKLTVDYLLSILGENPQNYRSVISIVYYLVLRFIYKQILILSKQFFIGT